LLALRILQLQRARNIMHHVGRGIGAHPGFKMVNIRPREASGLSKLALGEAALLAKTRYQPGKFNTVNSLLLLSFANFC
jgi:hypothetical protein